MQKHRLIVFKVKVKNNQRPVRAVIIAQRLFDNRAHVLEEMVPQSGFVTGCFLLMGYDGAELTGSFVDPPRDVLFNGHRKSCGACTQCAIDSVAPLSLIGIAIVGVKNRPMVNQIEGRSLGPQRRGSQQAKENRSHGSKLYPKDVNGE